MRVNVWFTSDFHLGHRNIIRYCNRPFKSTGEMDAAILDRLNTAVQEGDHLYFLGDFSLASASVVESYLRRTRCRNIFFVRGNHDKGAAHLADRFRCFTDLLTINAGGQVIVLCHYAMRTWYRSHRGAWQLYGHSHGTLPEDPRLLSMDVGVDTHDYRPWHLDEIVRRMRRKIAEMPPAPEAAALLDC